jgi:hypothetical protein
LKVEAGFANLESRDFLLRNMFVSIGPLNNMKESMIQFSKPRKLVNKTNPVSMS